MNKNSNLSGASVLPAYRETESISKILIELDSTIPLDWHFVVVDGSPTDKTADCVCLVFGTLKREASNLYVLQNLRKSSRGAAILWGFVFVTNSMKPDFLIEMDSDGSHTAEGVLRVLEAPKEEHFVIGSRYLSKSSIIGWSLTPRIFSRLINHVLKYIFRSELNDWTNGLRRYSAKAVAIQLEHEFVNRGFISLSEQTLLLKDHEILPVEVPITFIERVRGSGTVTYRELLDSIKGIFGIYIARKKHC
jgi:dolichol-phosphate mannosyltransferase